MQNRKMFYCYEVNLAVYLHLPMIPQEKRAVPWLMVGGSCCRNTQTDQRSIQTDASVRPSTAGTGNPSVSVLTSAHYVNHN